MSDSKPGNAPAQMEVKPERAFDNAFLQLQAAVAPLPKTGDNPHFGSSYTPLPDICEAFRAHASPLGFYHCETLGVITKADGTPIQTITVILRHVTGHERSATYIIRCKDADDPQKLGSAITYARRYALMSLLGWSPAEDDDGNAAATPPKPAAARPVAAARQAAPQGRPLSGQPNGKALAGAAQRPPKEPASDELVAKLHWGLGRLAEELERTPDQVCEQLSAWKDAEGLEHAGARTVAHLIKSGRWAGRTWDACRAMLSSVLQLDADAVTRLAEEAINPGPDGEVPGFG